MIGPTTMWDKSGNGNERTTMTTKPTGQTPVSAEAVAELAKQLKEKIRYPWVGEKLFTEMLEYALAAERQQGYLKGIEDASAIFERELTQLKENGEEGSLHYIRRQGDIADIRALADASGEGR